MRLRSLVPMMMGAVIAVGTVSSAFADEDWRWHQRHNWRERQEWREREEWRERAWREHEWRERHYLPPVVVTPPYGYAVPPPAFYPAPGYQGYR